MSFVGTIQTGPNADAYRFLAPAIITIPASGTLPLGTPLRRSYANIQGQNPSAYPYTAVAAVAGGDQMAVMTSSAGGFLAGVYTGATFSNYTGTTATSVVTPYVTKSGIAPVLVGCASGGTAVTIGAVVGMNSTIAATNGILANGTAAPTQYATVLTQPVSTLGSALGVVCGYPIVTNVGATAVTAGSSVAFYPPNVQGFSTTQAITINPGQSNAETVTPSSINVGVCATNVITFGNASATTPGVTVTLGNASTGAIPGVSGGIISVSIVATTATTGNNFAASVAAALNSAFQIYGAAPSNIPGIGGGQVFGIATAATSILTITAAIPTSLYNTIAVSTPVSGVSSIASGGTSLGGTSAGAFPTVYATFVNNHSAFEPIVGTVTTTGATICPVPQPGGSNVALAMVDLSLL
jgi:hypothetical protein